MTRLDVAGQREADHMVIAGALWETTSTIMECHWVCVFLNPLKDIGLCGNPVRVISDQLYCRFVLSCLSA